MSIFSITFGHGMILHLEKNSQQMNCKIIWLNNTNIQDSWS